MSNEYYIVLFVGFIFGVGFFALFDLVCEMFKFFHYINTECRKKKQEKNQRKKRLKNEQKSVVDPHH